ncbi:alpha/beta fold hydrolase [Oceanicola sp. S124]|uniref:alpha/beta fold hydrolase n=1 Tax=Oceanicola sp. S124 TaxID=1042378 RepID=UPI001ED8CDF6|nr:hypothetical protein [Oceanicola sp. S124]
MSRRFSFIPVLDHELHVTEWGDPSAPPLVMWHGLARTGRDFDELAEALSERYFVLCPDTIGRGLSSWSINPAPNTRSSITPASPPTCWTATGSTRPPGWAPRWAG